jgi:hypothetical protein
MKRKRAASGWRVCEEINGTRDVPECSNRRGALKRAGENNCRVPVLPVKGTEENTFEFLLVSSILYAFCYSTIYLS